MKIWAHTLVKNEERCLWYSVMSVIEHVDRLLLWDTGSADNTVKIAEEIKKKHPEKVEFREVGQVNADSFTKVRQEMLIQTEADWILLVDGDEVWWEDSISSLISIIRKKGKELESIVTPYINLVGDIYHYQEEAAGKYEIDGRRGHLTIRAMNRLIPGLHLDKPHGTEGFFDGQGALVQERSGEKRLYLDKKYLHFTHMVRSATRRQDMSVIKRGSKFKHEFGIPYPLDYYYPEVFFRSRPSIVPSPWRAMNPLFSTRALLETPLRKINRRILLRYKKHGY